MPELDLFGQPLAKARAERKRRSTVPNGYAARPGTGPDGKRCRDCAHICRVQHAKVYLKCGLTRPNWTRGPGSDIRALSPACAYFEEAADA